jgi:hypothetical protein
LFGGAYAPRRKTAASPERLQHDWKTHFVNEASGVRLVRYQLVASRFDTGLLKNSFQA